jgi:amino acid transporter
VNDYPPSSSPSEAPFQRVLSLWTLVLFGLAFVGPTAPFTFFGIGSEKSHGHFALVYLIALVAVSFTAVSYGRMATAFPEAGSTYAYAARALHPLAGFFAGWIMLLDYVLLPLLSVIIISANLASLFPVLPYSVCVVLCAALMTGVNLSGMKTTSLATLVFNLVLAVAICWFVGAAAHWLALRLPAPQPTCFRFTIQRRSLSTLLWRLRPSPYSHSSALMASPRWPKILNSQRKMWRGPLSWFVSSLGFSSCF